MIRTEQPHSSSHSLSLSRSLPLSPFSFSLSILLLSFSISIALGREQTAGSPRTEVRIPQTRENLGQSQRRVYSAGPGSGSPLLYPFPLCCGRRRRGGMGVRRVAPFTLLVPSPPPLSTPCPVRPRSFLPSRAALSRSSLRRSLW